MGATSSSLHLAYRGPTLVFFPMCPAIPRSKLARICGTCFEVARGKISTVRVVATPKRRRWHGRGKLYGRGVEATVLPPLLPSVPDQLAACTLSPLSKQLLSTAATVQYENVVGFADVFQ